MVQAPPSPPLEKRPVTADDTAAILRLQVRADQQDLVAPNDVTLEQAKTEPQSVVYGLWSGDRPVGLMALIDIARHPDGLTADDVPGSAFLWRLMIDDACQGMGFGRQAIALAAEVARDWGYAKLSSSVVDAPNSAMPFYEANGFVQTGGVIEGEKVIVRPT